MKLPEIALISLQKIQSSPQLQVLLECSSATIYDQYQSFSGPFIPGEQLEDHFRFDLTSSLSKFHDNHKVHVSAFNFSHN